MQTSLYSCSDFKVSVIMAPKKSKTENFDLDQEMEETLNRLKDRGFRPLTV